MKETPYNIDFEDANDPFAIKEILLKYLRYWRWFIVSAVFCIFIGLLYANVTPSSYLTTAKIKIIDDSKEMSVATDALSFMKGNSINLENEMEVLQSYRLLSEVVDQLKLDVVIFEEGFFSNSQIYLPPFTISKQPELDTLRSKLSYTVRVNKTNFLIVDEESKKQFTVAFKQVDGTTIGLPFGIQLKDTNNVLVQSVSFKVVFFPKKEAVINLSNALEVQATSKDSDILSLALNGENPNRSESILNSIIKNFDKDGILDRQLVSKRTLEVIDKRFVYLAGELDSIEVGKQDFKQANKLSYIEADAGQALQKKADTDNEVFQLESQISLTQMLKNTVVGQAEYSLLPADVGLENSSLNTLVYDYNQLALKRDKLIISVGSSHPKLIELSGQLERGKVNILKTVNVYEAQLKTSLRKLNKEKNLSGALFSKLPEKEKMLRSIERQQSIKENLFLLLLEKREEAAINLAVTAPSVKVIDYGVTAKFPISPKKKMIYFSSLLIGLFVPFLFLFIRFTLDTRINERSDIEKMNTNIPIVVEIPELKGEKSLTGANDSSVLAEIFRIGCTNVNYLLPKKNKDQGQVVFVTSGVKGEGKTLVAYNLSLAYASIKKRVLLVGADLRSPALNAYFNVKSKVGFTDYLSDPTLDWKACIHSSNSNLEHHKVCLAGNIPLNAAEILSSDRFGEFIENAKAEYDYIIVDTAPTLLVTDTLLISKYADVTLFVIRAGFTDKRMFDFVKNLNSTEKLLNMAYVLNSMRHGNSENYGYGYGYGSELNLKDDSFINRIKLVFNNLRI